MLSTDMPSTGMKAFPGGGAPLPESWGPPDDFPHDQSALMVGI